MAVERLVAAAVYHACDVDQFSFASTAELDSLESLSEALCQPRAVDSLRFGTGMKRQGFNIFVLGPSGTGRHSMVRQILDQKATEDATPSDWCYVNNFENSGWSFVGIHLRGKSACSRPGAVGWKAPRWKETSGSRQSKSAG